MTTATTAEAKRLAIIERALLGSGVVPRSGQVEKLTEQFQARPTRKLKRSVQRTLPKQALKTVLAAQSKEEELADGPIVE